MKQRGNLKYSEKSSLQQPCIRHKSHKVSWTPRRAADNQPPETGHGHAGNEKARQDEETNSTEDGNGQ